MMLSSDVSAGRVKQGHYNNTPFLTGLKDVGLLLESGNDPFDGGLEVFVDD
jgi:hypothetical protein